MAYSELVKNFDRTRGYMRQFFVFGFKSRSDFRPAGARSYDDERRQEKIVCELTDGRNALERLMLLFSYLKKETRKTGDDKYEVTLFCDKDDESEMIIRILSFGYLVKVVSPDSFRRSVAERIRRQIELFRRNSGRNGVCTE